MNDSLFADLRTGETYRVLAVFKARENDRHNSMMPEDVVQTFPAKQLSEQELADLRRQCKWEEGKAKFALLN